MQEVLPGVWHWTTVHPRIHSEVSSYYLAAHRVLLDPMEPPGGVEALAQVGSPAVIVLTNRHHYRDSERFVERFACPVRCHAAGLHEFTAGRHVAPLEFGEELAPGVFAREVGAICPEETAVHVVGERLLAFADAFVSLRGGRPGFVPDHLLGDDPEAVKAGLLASFRRLLELDFEHVLLAHGGPVVGEGRAVLEGFVRDHGAA